MDDGEAKLPQALPIKNNNLLRPINPSDQSNLNRLFNTTSSSSSSSSSSSPDFLRNVQAAFKRHRPLGMMHSNSIRPRRLLAPQRETSKSSDLNTGSVADTKKNQHEFAPSQKVSDSISQTKSMISVLAETQEDASITPPSMSGTILSTREDSLKPFDVQRVQPRYTTGGQNNDTVSSSLVESEHVPLIDGQKKVQFALENNARSHGADDQMATEMDNLLSHMSSLAFTEMEWDVSNPVEASVVNAREVKHQSFQNLEVDVSLRSDGGISSLMGKKTAGSQDQLHKFGNFLQGDCSHPMTQSSVVGSSCATTTLMNSASAPMRNSTTYCSHPHQNSSSRVAVESVDCDLNSQPMTLRDMVHPSHFSSNQTSGMLADQPPVATQAPSLVHESQLEVKEYDLSKGKQGNVLKECEISKDPPPLDDKSTKGNIFEGDVTDVKPQAPVSKNPSSDVKLEPSKSEKQENVASGRASSAPRKRNYDPDLFFKVNGKLYQRLGKIGSGGSSEVHKVISSDCTIYALKRIKLKGRDYATAYGFCQEIQYLNKLKGKSNIIQLIDYEVTDKALLKEVMNGSMSIRDGRFKEDGYIYMVLEYGEIDLAHMLSQKWRELDSSKTTIDENWLRFYWQQMLLAVNTIHEERIVHSDLKPANFLLVRGSLKLIDFGIAKAIMSDTTNIQRDSQVGTLSYMSPEAFLCNESDANGNTIKCGRPSDIWSLGCILYQMVYGRTPFSEYKTFWAKFKVITDPNHQITFEPVPNPWLLDLMKKCLAWHRNERWRIPELLTHPFLVPPPPPPQVSTTPQDDDNCRLLQLIAQSCRNDCKHLKLFRELEEILRDSQLDITSHVLVSVDQRYKLLSEISNLRVQLEEQLATSERE